MKRAIYTTSAISALLTITSCANMGIVNSNGMTDDLYYGVTPTLKTANVSADTSIPTLNEESYNKRVAIYNSQNDPTQTDNRDFSGIQEEYSDTKSYVMDALSETQNADSVDWSKIEVNDVDGFWIDGFYGSDIERSYAERMIRFYGPFSNLRYYSPIVSHARYSGNWNIYFTKGNVYLIPRWSNPFYDDFLFDSYFWGWSNHTLWSLNPYYEDWLWYGGHHHWNTWHPHWFDVHYCNFPHWNLHPHHGKSNFHYRHRGWNPYDGGTTSVREHNNKTNGRHGNSTVSTRQNNTVRASNPSSRTSSSGYRTSNTTNRVNVSDRRVSTSGNRNAVSRTTTTQSTVNDRSTGRTTRSYTRPSSDSYGAAQTRNRAATNNNNSSTQQRSAINEERVRALNSSSNASNNPESYNYSSGENYSRTTNRYTQSSSRNNSSSYNRSSSSSNSSYNTGSSQSSSSYTPSSSRKSSSYNSGHSSNSSKRSYSSSSSRSNHSSYTPSRSSSSSSSSYRSSSSSGSSRSSYSGSSRSSSGRR